MTSAWYKEPWFWFVIFFPILSVVAGVSTFILFNNHAPAMVSEDYYKDGKKINQDLSKINEAIARNITFTLNVDDGVAILRNASGDISANQALKISFFHVTLAEHDMEVLATAAGDNQYRVQLPAGMLTGKWRVRVESFDSQWRVQEYVQLPASTEISLDGKQG